MIQRRVSVSAGQQGNEVFDGLSEFALARGHREVDGIEVGFTAEATTEIGSGIHVRLALLAAWTDEHEASAVHLGRPAEMLDQRIECIDAVYIITLAWRIKSSFRKQSDELFWAFSTMVHL